METAELRGAWLTPGSQSQLEKYENVHDSYVILYVTW